MLIVLALAAAQPAPHPRAAIMQAALRPNACVTAACSAEPPRSRYRLDPDGVARADIKTAALAADGSECSVVGARVCTRKPRTILTADLGD